MKVLALLPLLYIHSALAAPASDVQIVLGQAAELVDTLHEGFLSTVENDVATGVHNIEYEDKAETWVDNGKEFVESNGLTYEVVKHSALPDHQLRTTEPHLCDPSVKQYSGYLDVTDGKHLFFWFFESRNDPKNDPLVLWLSGGPGCSSSTSLLFELGPCLITDEGKNTTRNPYSWNERANIIFLDQPIGVGYSYSSDGSSVSTSPVAGVDVHAFLGLFITRFPQYADLPFHLAAESYGGTYAPNIASIIYNKNKELALAPVSKFPKINLASVILANGLTDPYIQMASVPDYACDGPYPIYDDPEGPQCTALRSKVPTCQRLIKSCYDFGTRLTCLPATLYCGSQLFGPLQQTDLNLFDVRRKCDRSRDGDEPLCYKQMSWIEAWMNNPKIKATLGADPSRKFESCSMEIYQALMGQGDGMHNSALLLPELIEHGVRLLVYAGNADVMCNYMGNAAWVENLDSPFQKEFKAAPYIQWINARTGRVAGEVRTAGGSGFGAGNVTFVNVYEAGHMVPHDQPEAALDLFTRWISDTSLTLD